MPLTVHVEGDGGGDGRGVVEVGGATLEDSMKVSPAELRHPERHLGHPFGLLRLLGGPHLVVHPPLHRRRGAACGKERHHASMLV